MASDPSMTSLNHLLNTETENVVDRYSSHFDKETSTEEREEHTPELVGAYYQLVTDFYEYGFGECFHFFPVYDSQSFRQGVVEYDKQIAQDLHVKPGAKILDAGSGIGGPARVIARQTGGNITGLTISEYQVRRAKVLTEKAGLERQCNYLQGDYSNMHMFKDNSFDAAYACQSSCHSQDPLVVYKEIYRVLKPGGYFVDSAWVMTDKYEPGNPSHEKWKLQIMIGDGLPDIRTDKFIISQIKEAGLEIVESSDYRLRGDLPWYIYLVGKGCCSLASFRTSWIGRTFLHHTLSALEAIHLVPSGSSKTHSVLQQAAEGLIAGGKADIFSPMLHIVARKPL